MGQSPVPADSTLICRYIVHLSDKLKYVSIVNYISAVMVLHKLLGFVPTFRSDNLVQCTLLGLHRYLGDPQPNRPTMEVDDLLRLYSYVNLDEKNERAMWACLVFSFRTLLRKCNHEGVYTHLSAENVVSKWNTQTRNTQNGLSKKRPWFRCPRDVCLKLNQDACDRTDCRRKHVCATCRDNHRHSACKSKESKFT